MFVYVGSYVCVLYLYLLSVYAFVCVVSVSVCVAANHCAMHRNSLFPFRIASVYAHWI